MTTPLNAPKRRRWPRVLAAIASVLVLIGTGLSAGAMAFANKVGGNIETLEIPGWDHQNEPVPGEPINILVMGSDYRGGKNKGYGKESSIAGARSDTTMLVHISGDRTRVLGVSIPRDSKVQIPTCTNAQGQIVQGTVTRFNQAFDNGGPGCTIKAVQQLTGVNVDHFVVVDFNGFKEVVNAIGGVEVCLPKAVNDKDSKLKLPAGKSTVKGEQALAFVRARYSLGDASDIGRIDRQQDFLASALRKATSVGVISNPLTLMNVIDKATKSVTVDPGLKEFATLQALARDVQNIKPENVNFATIPWSQNSDKATISWVPEKAAVLWDAIKNDREWPPKPTTGFDGKPLTVAPSDITVNVLNGTTTVGQAAKAAASLKEAGFTIGKVANTKQPAAATSITAGPKGAEAARTVAAAFGAQAIVIDPNMKGSAVTVTIGPDYRQVALVHVVTPKAKAPTAATKETDLSAKAASEPPVC